MGAPGGGLKQCAQGRGQDRTSVGSPHMPKATFPFVTARQWVDGWRLFFLNTATVSAGHLQPCLARVSLLYAARIRGCGCGCCGKKLVQQPQPRSYGTRLIGFFRILRPLDPLST